MAINIKPQNRGKFTLYCKRLGFKGVTAECINKAKKSGSKQLKKRAVFAQNARKWNR